MQVYVEMTYRTRRSELTVNRVVTGDTLDAAHMQALADLRADKRRRVGKIVYSRATPMSEVGR